MRIALITDNNSLNVIDFIQERLITEIADAEVESFIVPFRSDIPFKASELMEAFDLIFVFTSFEKENFEITVVLEKLIDLELKSGTKIIKGFQEYSLSELEDINIEQEKKRLGDKWTEIILSQIFTGNN